MKKFFICLVLAAMAIGVQAQTTWNVRVGGGTFADDDATQVYGPAFAVECNIPFRKASCYIFSPSVLAALGFGAYEGNCKEVLSLWHLGYKVKGDGFLFIPKLGPMFGVNGNFVVGPSIEMAFEIKHLAVALNAHVDVDAGNIGAHLTFGYKF